MVTAFEAALTWEDDLLSFLAEDDLRGLGVRQGVRRRVDLREHGESFGLLEPDAQGWTLCIPAGAEAEVRVGDAPVDLDAVSLDASGERRLRVCEGLSARVWMGEFRFEVRPTA